jgi:hypothetical protein
MENYDTFGFDADKKDETMYCTLAPAMHNIHNKILIFPRV